MASTVPPVPNNPLTDTHVWRDWFYAVWQALGGGQSSGVNIRHNDLAGLQGGDADASEFYHLTAAQYNILRGVSTGDVVQTTYPTSQSPVTYNASQLVTVYFMTGTVYTYVTGITLTRNGVSTSFNSVPTSMILRPGDTLVISFGTSSLIFTEVPF